MFGVQILEEATLARNSSEHRARQHLVSSNHYHGILSQDRLRYQ